MKAHSRLGSRAKQSLDSSQLLKDVRMPDWVSENKNLAQSSGSDGWSIVMFGLQLARTSMNT